MSGKPSKESELARLAYERSGGKLTPAELAKRYKLAPSTIYRATWFKRVTKQ